MNNTCGTCLYFMGFGDWNLCCKLKCGLYYEDSPACEKYEKIIASKEVKE